MKKLLFIFLVGTSISYSQKREGENKFTKQQFERYSKANVEYMGSVIKGDGLFIYIGSKPIEAYTIIGDIRSLMIDNRNYNTQKTYLFWEAKEKYPKANGIIINTTENRWTAEVIMFEEKKEEEKETNKIR